MSKRLSCFILIVWFLVGASARSQDTAPASPSEVKAAFLYNFTRFVTWPEDTGAQNEIIIGVLGNDEVEMHLRRVPAGKSAQNRIVSVRRISSLDEVSRVHILFIGARESHRIAPIIEMVRQRPVLTVTESANGLERGSVINLMTNDRVLLEISLPAAAKAGLQLNSRLLSVAARIKKGEKAGGFMYALRMALLQAT